MSSIQRVVIVGASLAGAAAAEALRTQGFAGRVVLVGDEPLHPYQRPPLSKKYLAGTGGLDDVYLHDHDWYDEQGVELRTGTTVTAVEPGAHHVVLETGERVGYDRLLLATGSAPRRLDLPGAQLDGIHYLRTLADAEQLKSAAAGATSAAVVGAGWIGAEVAASLRQLGLPVTMLDVAAVPLERVLGPEVGGVYAELHAEHAVTLRMGDGIDGFEGDGRVRAIRTTGGATVEADLVVVGVGALPRTELAEVAGLKVDGGVVVDEHLRTSAPDVFAAGDVASAWHPLFRTHVRVEHWANARNQGAAAAASLLGGGTPYERIPYFFSDQYDLGMEYSGYATSWDSVVFRGDRAGREFLAFWLAGGVVVAAMNANIWDVTDDLQALVRAQVRVDSERLADPDVPLATLAERADATV